jgi:hypothetical protein
VTEHREPSLVQQVARLESRLDRLERKKPGQPAEQYPDFERTHPGKPPFGLGDPDPHDPTISDAELALRRIRQYADNMRALTRALPAGENRIPTDQVYEALTRMLDGKAH